MLAAPFRYADAQEGRPAAPDTVIVSGQVTGAPEYLRSFVGLPSAEVSADRGYVVVLAAGPTASTLDTMRVRRVSAGCFTPADAADFPPGSDSQPVALGGQTLVMIVLGAQKETNSCQIEWNFQTLTVWRAASQGAAGQPPARVPLAARLRVDGVPTEPLRAYTRPAFRRTAAGWERDGNQLRYYYDPSVVAPRADGQPRQLAVEVWDRDSLPAKLDFEPKAADRLALESIAWRLATGADGSQKRPLAFRSSRANGSALARMLDSATTDATRAGVRAASWASSDRGDLVASGVVARLVVAEALLGRGERALAQGMVASVVREHPCLVPPASSSPLLAELVRSTRKPSPRCEVVSPEKALALGIVPGMGHLALHDRPPAVFGAGLVAVALTRALMLNQQAKQRYAEYLAARQPGEARSIYRSVGDLQEQRGIALGLAGALWVFDALRATHSVVVHDRRIADDRY